MFFVHGIFQVFSQIGQVEQLHYAYETSVLLNGGATELGIHCDCAASFPSDGYHRYPRDPLEVSRFSRGNARGSWFLFPGGLLALPRRVAAVPRPAQCHQPRGLCPKGHGKKHATPLAATRQLAQAPRKLKRSYTCPRYYHGAPRSFLGVDGSRVIGFFILAFFQTASFLAWNGAR